MRAELIKIALKAINKSNNLNHYYYPHCIRGRLVCICIGTIRSIIEIVRACWLYRLDITYSHRGLHKKFRYADTVALTAP